MVDETDSRIGPLWWLRRISAWLVLLVCVALLAVMVIIPRVGGATPYTVLTGSMSPAYPPGSLVVIKPVAKDSIGVGRVITYQVASGKPAVVTHRVVAVGYNARGETRYTTKGDANNTVDRQPVRPAQIRGAIWYAVPLLGYLNSWLTGPQHSLLLWIVIGGLLLYAALMFTSAARDRDRARRHAQADSAGSLTGAGQL